MWLMRPTLGVCFVLVMTASLAMHPPQTSGGASQPSAPGAPAVTGTPAPLRALRGVTIVIDPGHNPGNGAHPDQINRLVFAGVPENHGLKACDTTGTQSAGGYPEAAYNWDVAQRLRRILAAAGAQVVMTRGAHTPPFGPCITTRAAIGNRVHAAAAVSIHAEGGPAGGRGFALIAPAGPIPRVGLTRAMVAADLRLARALRRAYEAGTGMPRSTYLGVAGIYQSNEYGGTNLSRVPKVFIETANMQNPTDAALLANASFRQRIARALAVGIARFVATTRR